VTIPNWPMSPETRKAWEVVSNDQRDQLREEFRDGFLMVFDGTNPKPKPKPTIERVRPAYCGKAIVTHVCGHTVSHWLGLVPHAKQQALKLADAPCPTCKQVKVIFLRNVGSSVVKEAGK